MKKIIVVDDEPEIIEVLKEFLGKKGYEVITALEGAEALNILLKNNDIDMMLLDRKMPKVDGITVLKKLKESGRDIPVILMTGSVGFEHHAEEMEKLGYVREDILIKPVDLYVLLNLIEKKLSTADGSV